MNARQRFSNKTAIITGAASGIGLETAKRLGAEGARIVLADLNADKLVPAREAVLAAGAPDAQTAVCDVSNQEQVHAAAELAVREFGGLHVVVNNAGLMIFKPLVEHTSNDWLKILSVDLLGAFYFTRAAFEHMKGGGVVVNVSSVHAVETTPNVASYAAAKAALLSLTRSASLEGKPKGIRVNAILPGAIDTPMLWENPNIKAGLEVVNKGDVGEPSNIASAIAFLASEDAEFIQGASLLIDGGRLARL